MERRGTALLIAAIVVSVFSIVSGGEKMLPFLVPFVLAHCDTMEGPVVKDAQRALETGKVDIVLKWVQLKNESEIKDAFQKTLAVRKLNPDARDLVDMYFFETVVRIHRAGEGEPYEGIKPAGAEVEPGIEMADKAVETGSVDAAVKAVSSDAAEGIRTRFLALLEKKGHAEESVEAGREYVEAYVTFIHYIQNLHVAILGEVSHVEGAAPAAHEK